MTRAHARAAVAVVVVALATGPIALADPSPAPATLSDTQEPVVDVHVAQPVPPWRRVSIEWNPLPFVVGFGKISANVVVVVKQHHALVLSPFFTDNTTAAIYVYNDAGQAMELPEQRFVGFGLELGYRYYWGQRGPRGLFMGPSLVGAAMFEHQEQYGNGSHTTYGDLGLAFDIGYQMLITNAITVSAGVGVQGLVTTQSIPQQQFPIDVYANSGIWPRALFSVGYAF
jgi:hypothetical protein